MLFETRSFVAYASLSIFLFGSSSAVAQSSATHQRPRQSIRIAHPVTQELKGEVLPYKWGGLSFQYPPGWHVEPLYYRTPPEEAAGTPASVLGFAVVPNGQTSRSSDGVYLGGRQAVCDSFPHCACFTVYETIHTCSENAETLKVFDLIPKTVRYNDPDGAFRISFPTAQDSLGSGKRYTVRWRTKPSLRIRRVSIVAHDTSTTWKKGTVLDAKNVPNTGRFEWLVPTTVNSQGPYLLEITFLKPIKVKPPALGGARIYNGRSEPFYIH